MHITACCDIRQTRPQTSDNVMIHNLVGEVQAQRHLDKRLHKSTPAGITAQDDVLLYLDIVADNRLERRSE